MLKKRILASSLASVMALSSVSVVAFADETASTNYGEAVTKSELKEFIKSFDEFLKSDVYEYGTVQADHFQDAIDYAENVINDSEATEKDCTAAYQMLKAASVMEKKNAKELQELIDDNKDVLDSENILNEDLGDHKWDQETYDDFVAAYYDAEKYVNSGDGRLITDAYFALEEAIDALSPLDFVRKSDFRTAIKEYEAIIKDFTKYEDWRRGSFTVNPTTTEVKLTKKSVAGSAFGTLKGVVLNNLYDAIDIDGASVQAFITKNYETFDNIKTSSVTTDETIVAAYKAAKDAIAIWKGWKADDTERAVKSSVQDQINKNRANMVFHFKRGFIENLVATVGTYKDKDGVNQPILKIDYDAMTIKAQADFELNVDSDTGLMHVSAGNYSKTKTEKTETKKIGKGQDVVKYIPVTSADVHAAYTRQVNLDKATDYLYARTAEAKAVYEFNVLKAIPATIIPVAGVADHIKVSATNAASLAVAADSETNAIVATDPLVFKGYELDTQGDAEDQKTIDAYYAAVEAVQNKYDELTEAETGLVAKATAMKTAVNGSTYKTEALALAADLVKYNDYVADIDAFLAMNEPVVGTIGNTTNKIIVDDTNNVAVAADIEDYNEEVIVEKDTYKAYKAVKENGDPVDTGDVPAEVKAWNAALGKFKTAVAATALTGADTVEGSVAKVKKEIKALRDAAFTTPKYIKDYEAYMLWNLEDALEIAEAYLAVDDKDFTDAYNVMKHIDDNASVGDNPTGSRTEWTLTNRYLKYAFDDIFPAAEKGDTYTKRQVEQLIEECYELAELTGEASIFADKHMDLVDGRKAALEWVGEANADKTYKEGNAVKAYYADYTGLELENKVGVVHATATEVYEALKELYDDLNDMLKDYPMSYGEIAELIATTSIKLDANGFAANADNIKTAVADVALKLSNLDATDDENEAFTADREFNKYNRLYVNGDKANGSETALKAAIDALNKVMEETTADVVKGDADGDGKVTINDALRALKASVGSVTLSESEMKAADVDGVAGVTALDALAILKMAL